MVYAKFGGQTECIMGNSKIENIISAKIPMGTPLNYGIIWPSLRVSRAVPKVNVYA